MLSTRPGELIISRGDHPVIRLRGGKVVSQLRSVFYRGPVARFFADATEELIEGACERAEVPRPEQDDGLEFAHLDFLESILLYTSDMHHGGALLFVPEAVADADARLLETASIKYGLPSTRPRDALLGGELLHRPDEPAGVGRR